MLGSEPEDLKMIEIEGQEEAGPTVEDIPPLTTLLSTREHLSGSQATCLHLNPTTITGKLSQGGAGLAWQEEELLPTPQV